MNYAVIGMDESDKPIVQFYENKDEARQALSKMFRDNAERPAYLFEQTLKMYKDGDGPKPPKSLRMRNGKPPEHTVSVAFSRPNK